MKKNFLFNLLLSFSNILFPIISFPYVARVLGPEGIGKVQFVFSYAQYFSLFAALGIPVYGIKEIAKHRDHPEKIRAAFLSISTIFFITSLFATLLYLTSVLSLPFFKEHQQMYLLAGVMVFLSFTYTDWYYAGREDFKIIAIRSMIVKAIALCLLYTLVKNTQDLYAYLAVLIFTIIGNQVYGFILVFVKHKHSVASLDVRSHIKPLLFIFGATAASSIYTIWDTILLGFLSNATAVGFYTASIKIVKLLLPFVTSVGAVAIPSLAHKFANNKLEEVKSTIHHSFYFIVFITIPMAIGIYVLAPELMIIFSGAAFNDSVIPMQILSLLPLLVGFGYLFAFQILIPAEKNKEVFIAMLAGLFISVLFNILLVPKFLQIGAAIATIATEIGVTVIYFYFTKKHFQFQYPWAFLFQSLLAAITFIPVVFGIRYLSSNIYIVAFSSMLICTLLYGVAHIFVFKNFFLLKYLRNKKAIVND